MITVGVPTELLDIDSKASPCQLEIQFSAKGDMLWIHMNGKTIVRIYGVEHITIENAHVDGRRVDLTWDA